jgi:3-hydroxybutyryl-CoA dehydrogenase
MNPSDVGTVAVIGAGTMGHSIAQVFAGAGLDTYLVDLSEERLRHALHLISVNLETLAGQGMIPEHEIPPILNRIRPTLAIAEAVARAQFVVEAVAEVPEVKAEVFSRLDQGAPAGAILASNTSSLNVFDFVQVRDPGRLVVAHWFAPPHIIPLVEVVPGPRTTPETVAFTAGLMARIGKRPIVMRQFVKSFIVNRIQHAIVESVLEMLANGWATPQEIDLAVKSTLGIRLPIVGVAQSLDFTGLQLVHAIQEASGRVNPFIEERVKQGHLGASTSRGLYDYGGRSEDEILRKRDELYIRMLRHLDGIRAFDPV